MVIYLCYKHRCPIAISEILMHRDSNYWRAINYYFVYEFKLKCLRETIDFFYILLCCYVTVTAKIIYECEIIWTDSIHIHNPRIPGCKCG